MSTEPNKSDGLPARKSASSLEKPSAGSTPWTANYPSSGEVDLVDLGVLLWRWRWLMLAVFLVFLALTIAATVLKRPTYEYTTTLQLGTVVSQTSGDVRPMMSAQSVAQALANTYIPGAMNQYVAADHPGDSAARIPKITAAGGSNDYAVVLSCRAKTDFGSVCITVEKIAADKFIRDNSGFVTVAQNQLTLLRTQAGVLQSQMDKLDAAATLYQQRAKALQQQIDRLQKSKLDAAKRSGSGSAAPSNTLINVELLHATDSLSTLQQNLVVGILQQRAQTSQQLSDNLQAQQLQQQIIDRGQIHTVDAGLHSLMPVGLGRSAILGIGILISIVLAFIAAFIAAYVQQVRARLARQTGN